SAAPPTRHIRKHLQHWRQYRVLTANAPLPCRDFARRLQFPRARRVRRHIREMESSKPQEVQRTTRLSESCIPPKFSVHACSQMNGVSLRISGFSNSAEVEGFRRLAARLEVKFFWH